jgi:hypothetical protein
MLANFSIFRLNASKTAVSTLSISTGNFSVLNSSAEKGISKLKVEISSSDKPS